MPRKKQRRLAPVSQVVRARRPDADVRELVAERRLVVDGVIVENPRALVRRDASVRVRPPSSLRGQGKLGHAIETFHLDVRGLIAIDVGAAAGGFTAALLEAGASRVYALDAGHGQLRGWLRQDPRVVDLEGHNVSRLDPELVPDVVDLVTIDLSYLAVADSLRHIARLRLRPGARLVALVKPTFELRRATVVTTRDDVRRAVEVAASALERSGWKVDGTCDAPRTGRKAVEVFVTATSRA